LYEKCQAKIVCGNKEMREWIIEAAKKEDGWMVKKNVTISQKVI
jgi:hypothetical protein